MSKASKCTYFLITLVFFILLNRYFFHIILNNPLTIPSNPIFDLVLVKNDGAAFSIFEGARWFLVAFSLCAIIVILVSVVKRLSRISPPALFFTSLLLAGIFCNVFERMKFGYVIDFIKLKFIDFPVFNISDIFINLSVLAIVIIIVKNSYIKKS